MNQNTNTKQNITQPKSFKNWEKWERFRESKMEKMRQHKHNVERRLRGDNIGDWTYWSQRRDKLKRFPKQEALDPSWYTDNIYANQSLDLDDEVPDYIKYDRIFLHNNNHHHHHQQHDDPLYDDEDAFSVHHHHHHNKPKSPGREYKYPKSRSCCFGGGYEPTMRPPIQTMPKSSSFSTARANGNYAKMREIRNDPHHHCSKYVRDRDRMYRRCSVDSERDNDFLYSRNRDGHKSAKTVSHHRHSDEYHPRCKKTANDDAQCRSSKTEYIRNEWYTKYSKNSTKRNSDKNGNLSFDDDVTYPQRRDSSVCNDDYLLENLDTFDSYDDNYFESNHHRSSFDNEMDQFSIDDQAHSMLDDKFDNDFMDELTYRQPPPIIRNKSMLEVKPPCRFDDTSSDSTSYDLDDFNFDFEKYWEELDKTSLDIDLQNNNQNLSSNVTTKIKNVNVGRYNNGTLIDDSRMNDPYLIHSINKNNQIDDLMMSANQPLNGFIGNDFNSPFSNAVSGSPIRRLGHRVHPESSIFNNFAHDTGVTSQQNQLNNNNNNNNNSALSLINNIFSIYKPKKYSPLNCHSQQVGVKPVQCKKMNVPSTIRPLGAPQNDFMTSLKRPLLVTPSPCVEQPRFKIIPEKTGLKISPLYRFDFDNGAKLQLKSTARPLLFPH